MKTFLAVVVAGMTLLAGRAPAQELVACGPDKVVAFEKTQSPDGRYALGWTVQPGPGKPPVDWSTFTRDGLSEWMTNYLLDDGESEGDYRLVNGVLDLRAKKFVPFKSDQPYFPGKNHADLNVVWSGEQHGSRFGVVNNDGRFVTVELWLLETNASGIHVTDIAPAAYRITRPYMRKHAAKQYDDLCVLFSAVGLGTDTMSPSDVFKDGKMFLEFDAEVPKSEVGGCAGKLTIALPSGKMLGISGR